MNQGNNAAANFDPDLFLSSQIDATLDTRMFPVPVGEYLAVIEDIKPRIQNSKDGTQQWLIFDIVWNIDDQKVRADLGREKVTSRQSLFIDRTPDGSIDIGKGRNVQLGKLREALGQNKPGAWAPSMLKGQVARVRVVQEPDKNTGDLYDKVVGVAKA